MAEGVELIGDFENSGFREPPALVRRGDGQIVQLTPLLYAVLSSVDGRGYDAIAPVVSERSGRRVGPDDVRFLVDRKLRPLGLVTNPDGSNPPVKRLDPLLALRFRAAVIPERVVHVIGRLFSPLFFPPVVLAVLGGLVAFDVWLFGTHGIAQPMRQALYEPVLVLVVLGLVVLSAAFHECGHAAGCTYSGGKPGAMGAGLYLAWPAFYTNVTDAYRLDRRGRLRTDLGGVYFNAVFVLLVAGLYALTGWEALLLVALVQHIEMAHQLLPFLRLDGYYIVADLTGVPDLFARIKPIFRSLLPWRSTEQEVRVLKPWVRVTVTVWVLLVVPLLALNLFVLLLHAPRILATTWDSLGRQADAVADADGDVLRSATAVLQSLLVVLPVAAISMTFVMLARRGVGTARRITEGRPVARATLGAVLGAAAVLLAFSWWPNGDYEPIDERERGTVFDAVAAVGDVPAGRPSTVSLDRAAATPPVTGDEPPSPAPSEPSPTVPEDNEGEVLTTTTTGDIFADEPTGSEPEGTEATTTTVDATTTTFGEGSG